MFLVTLTKFHLRKMMRPRCSSHSRNLYRHIHKKVIFVQNNGNDNIFYRFYTKGSFKKPGLAINGDGSEI